MEKLVSVIVPVYRVEKYLERCISSIVNQTYNNLEIILVDDGSDDDCPAICDKWSVIDDRIVVIHKRNEGLVAARKTGLYRARAEYVGYVDPDDWLELDFYEMLMSKMEEYDCDIVCSGRIEEFSTESRVCKNKIEEGYYTDNNLGEDLIRRMLCDDQGRLFNLYPTVWDKVFKKTVLMHAQMNVPEIINTGEDAACTYPAILAAKSVYVLNECKYHYNKTRDDSMLISRDSQYFMRLHALQECLTQSFKESKYAEELSIPLSEYIYGQALNGIWHEYGVKKHNFLPKDSISPPPRRTKITKTFFFPYELIPPRSDIVIYGAGKIGKQFVKQISWNHYCNVVKWIDQKNDNVTVFSLDAVRDLKFDFVVIAVADERAVVEIQKTLIGYGINESKIIWKAGYGMLMDGEI